MQLFLNNGDGAFGPGVTTYMGIDPGKRNLAVGDWNGDGALDLAAANYNGGSVSVFLNRCVAH